MSQPSTGSGRPASNAATILAGSSASASKAPSASASSPVQNFTVRIPKNMKKMHHVMRFNATLKVDFAQWKNVKMERENNMRDARAMEEEMPKFGAGSEYNRDQKEELRRKKLGIQARKYKQDAQPWILKVGGKSGKKFRGSREGGVGEYASFYVFAHATDGAIEAYPLHEWYNFQPIQRYKALSAEEAEQEFGRRNKTLNYFSLMMRNRLKGEDEGPVDPEEVKMQLSGKKGKEFKISDADDILMDSDDDSDSSGDEGGKRKEESDSETKKKGKKPIKKKKQKGSDDEAFEESDDGDEEGRELDYIESSSDESDAELQVDKDMKSVAEEDGLRKLLTSDEDSEDEKNSSDESNKDEKKEQKENEKSEKKKKKVSKKAKDSEDKKESLSDLSSDSSDSDGDVKKRKFNGNSASNSRSASPSLDGNSSMAGSSGMKRKMSSMPTDLGSAGNSNGASENSNSPTVTPAKKAKYDSPQVPSSFAGVISSNRDDNGITEEAVRRYLMRKPMTTTELLTKFKSKKTGVSSEKLVETMTQILKKINPVKQTIQGKMYLSIKNK